MMSRLMLCVISMMGMACCGPERVHDREAASLEPYVQQIDGTAITYEMVPVPGGDGVESFWIGRTEIPWEFYDVYRLKSDAKTAQPNQQADAVTRPSKPYISMDRGYGRDGYPLISVSSNGAETFCKWLSHKTGHVYTLPTVAQFRHACRLAGLDDCELDEHAWHAGNSEGKTRPIASLKADGLGLHDMLGNASEWCIDPDGQPVTLGGAFNDDPSIVSTGLVVASDPAWNESDPQFPKGVWWLTDGGFVGFRIVRIPGRVDDSSNE
ncbi:MAG: hypothetical protein CMJ32_01375 [Phycisphaerae bacterium]|nr:hypothetical protein [Phycisphaerae bacterium]